MAFEYLASIVTWKESFIYLHTRNIILKDLSFTKFIYTENFTQGKGGLQYMPIWRLIVLSL